MSNTIFVYMLLAIYFSLNEIKSREASSSGSLKTKLKTTQHRTTQFYSKTTHQGTQLNNKETSTLRPAITTTTTTTTTRTTTTKTTTTRTTTTTTTLETTSLQKNYFPATSLENCNFIGNNLEFSPYQDGVSNITECIQICWYTDVCTNVVFEPNTGRCYFNGEDSQINSSFNQTGLQCAYINYFIHQWYFQEDCSDLASGSLIKTFNNVYVPTLPGRNNCARLCYLNGCATWVLSALNDHNAVCYIYARNVAGTCPQSLSVYSGEAFL